MKWLRNGRIKPVSSAQLNRASPFARDAVIHAFNDASLVPLGYVTQGLRGSMVGTGIGFAQSNGMPAIRLTATNDYIEIDPNAPNPRLQSTAFTLLVAFRQDNFAAVSTLVESDYAFTSTTNSFQLRVETNGTILAVKDNVAVISASSSSDPIVKLGKVCVLAVSYDNTTCNMALDGYDITQSTSAQTVSSNYHYALGIKSGDRPDENTRPLDFYLFGYWPRAMSRRDLVQLSRDPGQLFERRHQLWLPPSDTVIVSGRRPQVFTMT
ncbi:hypothetical protein ACHMW6_06500 [Pseudoduganella sp. UC29_106]|uniref:hypothetical protein n=1 Tax=Pseudoduganella sp. UC29_106 TaxID=3374553 RepID=UPI003757A034